MKKHIILSLILILFNLIGLFAKEIRSLWALPWNLANTAAIDQLVADAVSSRQTEILAEVRYRADALYIPNRLDDSYNNPEPRSNVVNLPAFDPLGYLLQKAHNENIEVQAWVTVFCATTTQVNKLPENYLYSNHADWIMTDESGNRMGLANQMGYFIDPGIPEVQEHLYNVIMDIATGYPELDGIHLDYIRYPTKNYGYHPISVQRFKDYTTSNDITWNTWRIAQVTGFVKHLNAGLKGSNPSMLLTAAVISYIDEAKVHYAQDWVNWLKDGDVDRVYPMAYASGNKLFNRTADEIAAQTVKEKVIMGLRAWQEPGAAYYGVEKVIEKAEFCRKLGFGGLALFSYEGIKKANMLPKLTSSLYYWSEPTETLLAEDEFITALVPKPLDTITRTDTIPELSPKPIAQPIVHQNTSQISEEFLLSSKPADRSSTCSEVTFESGKYQLFFFFSEERRWKWDIKDIDGKVVYEKFRTYPMGGFVENWDGYTNDGVLLSPGVYTIMLYEDTGASVFQKRFIVQL